MGKCWLITDQNKEMLYQFYEECYLTQRDCHQGTWDNKSQGQLAAPYMPGSYLYHNCSRCARITRLLYLIFCNFMTSVRWQIMRIYRIRQNNYTPTWGWWKGEGGGPFYSYYCSEMVMFHPIYRRTAITMVFALHLIVIDHQQSSSVIIPCKLHYVK